MRLRRVSLAEGLHKVAAKLSFRAMVSSEG